MTGDVTRAELLSQPQAWTQLVGRLESGALTLPVELGDYDEILLLGSGTSYYLSLAVADWLQRRGHAAWGVPSCEVLLDPHLTRASGRRRLAIGFSRSGRSSELLLANERLAAAGFTIAGVSCTEGSDLLRQAGIGLLIADGHEDGLVMLRSLTSMLIAAQWLFGDAGDRRLLAGLPAAGRALLQSARQPMADLARARGFERFVFLGSGPDYPLAREAALKIQEMAIATSEAYHSLDYRHGPKACAGPDTLVTLFTLAEPARGRDLVRDIAALGAATVVVGPEADAYAAEADVTIRLPPPFDSSHGAALSLLPVQLLAYETAIRRGCDPDAPLNLTKVVTL